MKTKNIKYLFLISILIIFIGNSIFAMSAYEVMKKNDQLPSANSSVGTSTMVILKGQEKTVKEFTMTMKKTGKQTRSRITFQKPTHIELLSHSNPSQDSQQWLKLSGGKVRKLASSEKNGSFVNSHFYYEDLGSRDIEDFNYTSLPDAKINGEDCYVISGVKKGSSPVYSKAVMYVRKSDFFIVQVQLFEKNKHTKTMRSEAIEKINGILTPKKVVMERTDGAGKTILYIQSIKYNAPVSDASLSSSGF